MTSEVLVPRKDINVDYHVESQTWGIRLYSNKYHGVKFGQFVSWGATSPMDCKNLPYYHYPLEEFDD